MPACVRTARHKYVVKVRRLSIEDAHLTGGEDRVYVMANRIGDDRSRGAVKCGASRRRPGTGDRIAHACPGKAFAIRTLHTDQRRDPRVVVGYSHARSSRGDPGAVGACETDEMS